MTSRTQPLPAKIAVSDAERGPDPFGQVAKLARGEALIFRHYELCIRDRLKFAEDLGHACRQAGVRFLVAGDPRLALAVRADGLHLPGWLLRQGVSWKLRPRPGWLVTAAAHDATDLVRAGRTGVDACLLSPVFPTDSHPGALTLGPLRFAALAETAPVPVYALGGMTETSARRLGGANMAGIAGISGV